MRGFFVCHFIIYSQYRSIKVNHILLRSIEVNLDTSVSPSVHLSVDPSVPLYVIFS